MNKKRIATWDTERVRADKSLRDALENLQTCDDIVDYDLSGGDCDGHEIEAAQALHHAHNLVKAAIEFAAIAGTKMNGG